MVTETRIGKSTAHDGTSEESGGNSAHGHAELAQATDEDQQLHGLWRWYPLGLLALSAFGVSVQTLLSRQLTMQAMTVMEIVEVRGIVQLLGCLLGLWFEGNSPYVGLRGRGECKEVLLLCCSGGLQFGGIFFGFQAAANLPLAEAAIVLQTAPITSAAFAWVCLGERWHCAEFVGSLLALLGVLLVSRPAWLFPTDDIQAAAQVSVSRIRGISYGLLGSASAGLAFVLFRLFGTQVKIHYAVVVLYAACGQIVYSLLLMWLSGQPFLLPHGGQFYRMAGIGIVGFLAQVCMTKGAQREKAALSALTRQGLAPVFAFIWQVTFLPSDPMTWTAVAGFVLLLCAMLVAILGKAWRERNQKASNQSAGDELMELKETDGADGSQGCT